MCRRCCLIDTENKSRRFEILSMNVWCGAIFKINKLLFVCQIICIYVDRDSNRAAQTPKRKKKLCTSRICSINSRSLILCTVFINAQCYFFISVHFGGIIHSEQHSWAAGRWLDRLARLFFFILFSFVRSFFSNGFISHIWPRWTDQTNKKNYQKTKLLEMRWQ